MIKNSYLYLMDLIERNISKLTILCKQHKVKELYIFGSILTKGFNDSSDIDFLVQFDKIDILDYFDNYMDFKEKLENLFGRQIDLLENQAIRNPIFRKVLDRDKRLVYDRETASIIPVSKPHLHDYALSAFIPQSHVNPVKVTK